MFPSSRYLSNSLKNSQSFDSIDINSDISQWLWRISQIIGCSPFSEDVLSLTYPQMEYILNCYIRDRTEATENPQKPVVNLEEIQRMTEIISRLEGKALKDFLAGKRNPG